MLQVFDAASSQRNLDFALAARLGYVSAYIKLGGDNSGRYVAPYYVSEVDKCRAASLRVGHYWVPDGRARQGGVVSAADFYSDNLRGFEVQHDYIVLDDEDLNGATHYNDADAAAWFRQVMHRTGAIPAQCFIYLGAYVLRDATWPQLEALGVRLIVSVYGDNDGAYPGAPNLGGRFGGVWAGHQYTSVGKIGGITTDLNVFQDWAFNYDGKVEITLTWTADEEAKVDWLVDASNGEFFRHPDDKGNKRISPLADAIRSIGAIWSWLQGHTYIDPLNSTKADGSTLEQDSGIAKIVRQANNDPVGLATNAVVQDIVKQLQSTNAAVKAGFDRLGNPTVTVALDQATLTSSLKVALLDKEILAAFANANLTALQSVLPKPKS